MEKKPTPETKLTFKPLTQKRYRCNQTGEVTKHPKKYALAYFKAEQNKLQQQRGMITPKSKKSSEKNESRNYFSNLRSSFSYSNSERRFGYF